MAAVAGHWLAGAAGIDGRSVDGQTGMGGADVGEIPSLEVGMAIGARLGDVGLAGRAIG